MSQIDQEAPLVDHLTELRKRVINSIVFIGIGFIVCWFYKTEIFSYIRKPIHPYLPQTDGGLVFAAPTDMFFAYIKVASVAGVIISAPFWLYQLWMFVSPALYKEEKKFGFLFIFFGTLLFLSGVAFVYYVVYPAAFGFLLSFGGGPEKPMIHVDKYLSFITTTTLAFGTAFEMPLVLFLLALNGVISSSTLRNVRRYAIVIIATASAILTPPDVFSQILMIIPLYSMYEGTILVIAFMEKRRSKNQTSS